MAKKVVEGTLICIGVILCTALVYTCEDVMTLKDVEHRGTGYVGSNPLLSDKALPAGWYFAQFNNFVYAIPDITAPELAHCGTYNPLYIRDKIPETMIEGKEYAITACLVDMGKDCKQQFNIKIRRCGVELHYYLVPTDGTSAYCFDATKISVIAPAPNYRIPGSIRVSTALMYIDEPDLYRPELNFKCVFDAARQYLYQITWSVNDHGIFTSDRVKLEDIDSTNLNESLLLHHGYSLGINIQCSVRISSTQTGNQTDIQNSTSFFAGINVTPGTLSLRSAQSAVVRFTPTVPLGCRHPKSLPAGFEPPCTVSVTMFDPNEEYNCQKPGVATVDLNNQKLCGTTIQGWRHTEHHTCLNSHHQSCVSSTFPHTDMTVTAINDRLEYPDDQIFYLQTHTSGNTPHDFWEASRLNNVQVNYVGGSTNNQWMGKECHAITDPHLITFDREYWDLQDGGNFVMYRNTDTDDTVQIRTSRCTNNWSGAFCNCAVAIRSKGDVFKIDVCSSTKVVMFSHCENNILDVRNVASTRYDVYFPTGTRVRVDIGRESKYLDVYVYPTASDVQTSEGLCGNLNNIREENARSYGYANKWRISSNSHDDMFSASYEPPTSTTEQIQVCLCPKSRKVQQGSTDKPIDTKEAQCYTETYASCEALSIIVEGTKKSCRIRSKRSVHRHKTNTRRILQIINESQSQPVLRKRRSTPVSNDVAYKMCKDYFITKPIYQLADEMPSVSVENELQDCMKDVVLNDGDTFWTQAHFSAWSSSVVNEIGRNGTFRKVKQDVVSSFKSATCPNDCNGNGKCVNGTCVCDTDYVGDSCFVQKSAPLDITYIDGEGTCDISLGLDCHECLHVFSTGLLEDFKCNIKTHEVSMNGTTSLQHDTTHPGEYESLFDGFCCPKAMEGRKKRSKNVAEFVIRYEISISNVGNNFGGSRDVYVYDSTCQQYTVLPTGQLMFSLKPNTCYIDGQCYVYGANRDSGTCDVCYPPDSVTNWTYNCNVPPLSKSSSEDTDTSGLTVPYIVLIVSATCLMIAVIVVIVVMVVKCNKGKRNIGASHEDFKTIVPFGPGNNRFGTGPSVISDKYPEYTCRYKQ